MNIQRYRREAYSLHVAMFETMTMQWSQLYVIRYITRSNVRSKADVLYNQMNAVRYRGLSRD